MAIELNEFSKISSEQLRKSKDTSFSNVRYHFTIQIEILSKKD
jgi:hypothetical protein